MTVATETRNEASAQAIAGVLDAINNQLGLSEHPPRLFMRSTGGWIVWSGADADWPSLVLRLAAFGGPLAPAFINAVRYGYDFIEHGDKLRVFKGR